MKEHIIRFALVSIAILAVIAALYAWFKPKPVVNTQVYQQAQTSPEIKKTPKQTKTIKHITVLDKKQASDALGLPESVSNDKDKEVLGSAEIKPYGGSQSVTAVIDTKSGDTEMLVKQKPLPFFQLKDEKEIGIRFGTSTNGTIADIYGRWTFARIGSVHLAGYGEVSGNEMNTRAKAMLEASYRW